MLGTLYGRLAVSLLVVLLLAAGLFVAFDMISNRRMIQEINQDVYRDLAAHLLEESIPIEHGEIQQEALEHIFHILMVINPAIEVYLLGDAGQVLAYSGPEGSVVRMQVGLDPIRQFLAGAKLPILGDDPRSTSRRKAFSVAAIDRQQGGGYLYVILGGEQYESTAILLQASRSMRLGLGALMAVLLVVAVTGLLLFSRITKPVRTLAGAVKRFQRAGFAGPLKTSGAAASTELGGLETAFAEMGERISEQMREIRRTDALRRDLVANVSHDLRTPITSLRGYLETLSVKAHQLSEDEKREYLAVALRHSERLGDLVASLFELSKLDSLTTELNLERVALAEFLSDVLQGFQLRAEAAGITLEGRIDPRQRAFVETDVGLLERVLGNLLENAIRHTPPGGKVTLALTSTADGHRIEVEDTGPGIAQDDLPHLFDRFYRCRSGSGHGGAGLGLAIAQQAVHLLGGQLEVATRRSGSTGSEFFFALQPAP